VNRTLSVIERVRRFIVVARAFSVDNGQLTPTLKLRRHVILEEYRPRLDALYGAPCAPAPPHKP
jgi:long-chain acyl-CoA synthetase